MGDGGKGVESAVSYRVATVDELHDIAYREDTHMRPVRHHLGITAFGTNAWTAANEGDRLVPEHQEDEGSEELYVVLRGRARFEIDGDTVDAPEGTLVFVRPQGNRTAFADEPGTTVLAIGSTVGKAYEAADGKSGRSSIRRTRRAPTTRLSSARERRSRRVATRHRSTTSPAARHWPAGSRTRSNTFRSLSRSGRASVTSRRKTATSTRSGTTRRFASSSTSGPKNALTDRCV